MEAHWIAEAAGGDFEAFDRLMKLHEDRIYQICLRLLGCREDAKEAAQDVFVRAFQALPRYRARAKFTTWLYQIALNRCRDSWKKSAARLLALSDPIHLRGIEPVCEKCHAPSDAASQNDDVGLVQEALLQLSSKDREIVILCCVDELAHSECAEVLGCSERAIEGRLYRARKKLRQAMAARDRHSVK